MRKTFTNILNVSPELNDRTFIINGVSKVFSMTGWRIGYGAGNEELIKSISKIQSQCTTNPCSISQMAAIMHYKMIKNFLMNGICDSTKEKTFYLIFLDQLMGLSHLNQRALFIYMFHVKVLLEKNMEWIK